MSVDSDYDSDISETYSDVSENVIDMNYSERVDLLNESKEKLSNLFKESKQYIIEVIILLIILFIACSQYISYVPQLPVSLLGITRLFSTNNVSFPTTETYQTFFEKSLTLILIFIIIKNLV